MTSISVLIDKLTNIELSVGLEDYALRNKVIDAQDCALQVQREVAEILRRRSQCNAVLLTYYLRFGRLLLQIGGRQIFAVIRPRASPK